MSMEHDVYGKMIPAPAGLVLRVGNKRWVKTGGTVTHLHRRFPVLGFVYPDPDTRTMRKEQEELFANDTEGNKPHYMRGYTSLKALVIDDFGTVQTIHKLLYGGAPGIELEDDEDEAEFGHLDAQGDWMWISSVEFDENPFIVGGEA